MSRKRRRSIWCQPYDGKKIKKEENKTNNKPTIKFDSKDISLKKRKWSKLENSNSIGKNQKI